MNFCSMFSLIGLTCFLCAREALQFSSTFFVGFSFSFLFFFHYLLIVLSQEPIFVHHCMAFYCLITDRLFYPPPLRLKALANVDLIGRWPDAKSSPNPSSSDGVGVRQEFFKSTIRSVERELA